MPSSKHTLYLINTYIHEGILINHLLKQECTEKEAKMEATFHKACGHQKEVCKNVDPYKTL